ncbi:MAG: FAD-binding oxidoreductase [Pseudomonadota bacterium]
MLDSGRMFDEQALEHLKRIAGPDAIVLDADQSRYLEEWRGRWHGTTPLIVKPASTRALSDIMAFAYQHDISMVPQGGNTGLVGGQIPQGDVLISTERLTAIRDRSAGNDTLTVEAGVTLAHAQRAASDMGRLLPLSFGSENRCQIGGALSTNAGGLHVVRYGNARDLCLGIEAVLPDGRIWHGLNTLRKNNVGYDLKQLLIGGEGTLGVITAAVLKLSPQPAHSVTILLALPSADAAVSLLGVAKSMSHEQLSAFELLSDDTLDLIVNAFPTHVRPSIKAGQFYALIEMTANQATALNAIADQFLQEALQTHLALDGLTATTPADADALWQLRFSASASMKKDPTHCLKCDISVPVHAIPAFLIAADACVEHSVPGARPIAFGHMGDGNLHYDVLGPLDMDATSWRAQADDLTHRIHDVVIDHDGSISAEHGIGVLKRDELAARKDPVELALMQSIKQALDPKGLMNPGKLLVRP